MIEDTYTVLVVDDNENNRYVLSLIIEEVSPDITVLEAESGPKALEVLNCPDVDVHLILLDVQMPQMNGYEVAKLLKSRKSTQHIPIIFQTAIFKEDKFIQHGYDLGAIDYLEKPLEKHRVINKLGLYYDLYVKDREVRLANQKLAQSNKDLENFAGMVAHDLKSPLTTVQSSAGLAQLMIAQGKVAESEPILEKMVDGVQNMVALIDDLLKFAKLEATPPDLQAIDLAQTIEETIEQMGVQRSYPDAKINILTKATIKGDKSLLSHLFQNLIGNAIKYQNPGVNPVVDILDQDVEAPNHVSIVVKDNGVGFDPARAEEIFGFLKRAHSASEFSGTGIGLAICKRVVEIHGGKISATSQLGDGSEFKVSFPTEGMS